MAGDSKKELLKTIRNRNYLAKDFDALKQTFVDYARTYFPNVRDLSESSVPGMMIDLAAYVGDIQSFYLDHQFLENFPDTSTELNNIERHLKNNDVPIVGSSPAIVNSTFYIKVSASGSNPPVPNITSLPIIKEGSVVKAQSGIEFELTEDLDYTLTNENGDLSATIEVGTRDVNNNPQNFILSLAGVCISGFRAVESFSVNGFEAFKKITLANENVTEIIKVTDSRGNVYYEVDYLTQDTVYKKIANTSRDQREVDDNLVPTPAPYRFIKNTSLQTRLTTLTFGGASAETLNDDIIPDPSEFALPLYGKQTMTRFTINPGNLLQTTTFGVLTPNTTLTVTYRYGGGLDHNIEENSIRNISKLDMVFPNNPLPNAALLVRNSVDVNNLSRASGGDDAPSPDELKAKIPAHRAAQGRIVTRPDLLSRVYTLPSNFGRVFRASIQNNPNNPLASQLFVICRNSQNQLITAPDTLKKNLATYLSQYRMINDAIDILDARIINLKVSFSIVTDTNNKQLVLKNVLQKLKSYFSIKNYEIDQPIVLGDIQNVIYNNPGVVSVVSLEVQNTYGIVNNRSYSSEQFDVPANTTKGILFSSPGSIFEIKYPDFDLIGSIE